VRGPLGTTSAARAAQLGRPAQRVALHDDAHGGTAPAHGRRLRKRRLTGAGTVAWHDGRAARRSGRHGGGSGSAASNHGGRDAHCRAMGEACGGGRAAVGRAARGAVGRRRDRRGHCRGGAVGTRVRHAARGSHAATAGCRASPARRAASDRWGLLVSDFRIKIHPG
jgi:hypothetical protein